MADQYQPRVIRVFVSSVFRDMQAERDCLHKLIFPRLRQLCDARDVILDVVDLWLGVSGEDTAQENVLQFTLEELQRSRPYYIGLVGERYGRVVENIPDELLKRWPLLAEYHGRSTIELEIVCGVLADDAMHGRGFFYFRDSKFLDRAPERRPDFTGQSIEDEEKLEDLKQRIRDVSQQGLTCRLRENYRNVEELGEWILNDFSQLIDELSPSAERQTAVTPGDDDVMFTVYRPGAVVPQKWYSLLAFAHLSERRPDAPPDEPDPLAEVHKQARQVLGEKMAEYRQSSQDSSSSVPHAGEITFKPFIAGFDFNPSSRSFRWEESVHREEFKMRAATATDGEVAKGWLRVYLGPLILAQINLSIKVDSRSVTHSERQAPEVESARPLRRVFASYSHKDRAIVERIEECLSQTHLGIEYLRDATSLRVGEEWSPRLKEMIRQANAFQLFWSTNSMRSDFVRQEYQYALSLGREHFVLPVYWETPFPEKREDGLPPDELRRLHFENLSGSTPTPHYSAPDPTPTGSIGPPSSFEYATQPVGEEFLAPADPITMELAQPKDAAFSDAPTDQLEEPPVPWPGHVNEPGFCPQCGKAVHRLAKFCARCGVLLQTPGRSTHSGALLSPPNWPEEDLASSRDYPTLSQARPTQITTGTVRGTVTDANGAAIPGANVEVKNLDTDLATHSSTDEDGRFIAFALLPGPYSVAVSKYGFPTALILERVELKAGQAITLSISMSVSAVEELVTSSATPTIDAVKADDNSILNETAARGTLIPRQEVQAQPMGFETRTHDDASIMRGAPPPADSAAYGRGYAYPAEAPPLPAPKKSYGALILGLGAVAFGFLIFVPVALIAIATTTTAGSSGSSGGGVFLFLFFVAGLLVIGGGAAVVVLLLKRRR